MKPRSNPGTQLHLNVHFAGHTLKTSLSAKTVDHQPTTVEHVVKESIKLSSSTCVKSGR